MAEDGAIYYMWPTMDDKETWVVATRFEGKMDTVFKKVAAAGLPKPIPMEGPPPDWSSKLVTK